MFRDSAGAYTRDEWTSFGDIGRSFDGVELTRGEYERVEDASTWTSFLDRGTGVDESAVRQRIEAIGPDHVSDVLFASLRCEMAAL